MAHSHQHCFVMLLMNSLAASFSQTNNVFQLRLRVTVVSNTCLRNLLQISQL
ncbi:hypothetical protein HanIR_Chr01g0008711 [Helianthus annuus]|nr:hypothetical protein HanIR_Chr01g0008711 [Helianthus annuus]